MAPSTPQDPWSHLWLDAFNRAAGRDHLHLGTALVTRGAVTLQVGRGHLQTTCINVGASGAATAVVRGQPVDSLALEIALSGEAAAPTELGKRARLRRSLDGWLPRVLAGMDLGMRCTCPSAAGPCPHLAALALKFAAEIDREPLRLLDFSVRDFRLFLHEERVAAGQYWLGGDAGPDRMPPPPRVDLPLRITPPPPYKGVASDVDVLAVMREVGAACAQIGADDVDAGIAAVTFGLPAPPGGPSCGDSFDGDDPDARG